MTCWPNLRTLITAGATDIQHIDNIFCGYMGTLVLETDK